MSTQATRTFSTAAIMALLATGTSALAQATGSENSDRPQPTRSKATARPVRPKPDHPAASMPWWMRHSSVKVMPSADAGSQIASQAKDNKPVLRTRISKPDGPGLPHHSAPATEAHGRPDSITLSDGRILQRDGTITRDGEIVSRDTCISHPDGRVVPIADLLAKEKAVFNADGTMTLSDGRIMKVEASPAHKDKAAFHRPAPGVEPSAKDKSLPATRRTTVTRTKATGATITPVKVPAPR